MKISVLVKPNSKTESVEKVDEKNFVVRVHVPPVENQANERTRELLSKYLGIPKRSVELVSGKKSKKKVFEIA